MTTKTGTSTAVDVAREAVLAARAAVVEMEEKRADAQRELAAVEESAGEAILADPAAAGAIESRLSVLRATMWAAERALAAAQPKVAVAESAYLTAEADALEVTAAAARSALEEHNATTQRLLAQLEAHEGVFVPVAEVRRLRGPYDSDAEDTPAARKAPRSLSLEADVRRLEDQVTVLREMAAGRDPREWERQHRTSVITGSTVVYPACVVGPDALVQAPNYVEAVARVRATVAELEELLERTLPDELDQWQARADRGAASADATATAAAAAAVRRIQFRLEQIPSELDAARQQLLELTGADRELAEV